MAVGAHLLQKCCSFPAVGNPDAFQSFQVVVALAVGAEALVQILDQLGLVEQPLVGGDGPAFGLKLAQAVAQIFDPVLGIADRLVHLLVECGKVSRQQGDRAQGRDLFL